VPTIVVGVAAEIDFAGALGTRVTSGWSSEASARTFVGPAVEVDAAGPVVAAK
jgi:hypothetical protein